MGTATGFILSYFILLTIVLGYYFLIERPKILKKKKSNVIQLQKDGFDFILYKGKIKEMLVDYHPYLGDMDIIVYSKSLFVGFVDPRQTYLDLSAKAIQYVRYEPNKVIISCFKELTGIQRIVIKGNSTKHLYQLSKKIDFISRRSKKVKAM